MIVRSRPSLMLLGLLLCVCGTGAAVGMWAMPADLALRRARMSLRRNHAERTLHLLSPWLMRRPSDAEALELRAEAQLMLGRLGAARGTLDHVIRLSPERPEARKLMTTWVFRTINDARRKPDFAQSKRGQARFDSALTMGFAQADWLSRQSLHDSETRSLLLRARLLDADIRWRRSLADVDSSNSICPSTPEKPRTPIGPSVPRQPAGHAAFQETELLSRELEQRLRRIIETDRRHYPAWTMYIDHLIEREDGRLWAAADELAEHRSLPATLGAKVAETLLTMPDPALPLARRIDRARRVLSAVIPAEQSRPDWMLAAARVHLSAGETTQAHHFLHILVRDFPPDADTRYLLARCLVDQE